MVTQTSPVLPSWEQSISENPALSSSFESMTASQVVGKDSLEFTSTQPFPGIPADYHLTAPTPSKWDLSTLDLSNFDFSEFKC